MCIDATNRTVEEVDVRNLPWAQRHEMIFEHIYGLAFGASFNVINDQDLGPLLDQLEADFPRQFLWTYFEEGPSVWRAEICRRDKSAWQSAKR
jgi:uncharacterized protein (DUF2249 family)